MFVFKIILYCQTYSFTCLDLHVNALLSLVESSLRKAERVTIRHSQSALPPLPVNHNHLLKALLMTHSLCAVTGVRRTQVQYTNSLEMTSKELRQVQSQMAGTKFTAKSRYSPNKEPLKIGKGFKGQVLSCSMIERKQDRETHISLSLLLNRSHWDRIMCQDRTHGRKAKGISGTMTALTGSAMEHWSTKRCWSPLGSTYAHGITVWQWVSPSIEL